jgi:hypothetical protein
MAHRIDLNAIPAADRQGLVDLMLTYLTDDVIDDHMSIIHSGVDFFTGHRAYLGAMETWLAANGGAQFVPLPEWTPANPIPPEFNVVKAPRPALQNLNPNMPPAPGFAFPGVCSTLTLQELSDAVNPWHGGVHVTIGGAMGNLMDAPAAPIFWCWHAYLDDIYFDWESCANAGQDGHEHPEKGYDEYENRKREYEERSRYWEEQHVDKHTTFEDLAKEYESAKALTYAH